MSSIDKKENDNDATQKESPESANSAEAGPSSVSPSSPSQNNNNNTIKDDITTKIDKKVLSLIDPWYNFEELPPIKLEGEMHYTPSYFLRTHSKNNNTADVQTQIWQCCFAPPTAFGKTITSDVVATCGGSSVCFIDVTSGDVLIKYNRSTRAVASENLYALCWSTLEIVSDEGEFEDVGDPATPRERGSVVAAGGGKSTVVLVDVEAGYCYHMFRTVTTKTSAIICSLLFHPKKQSWLFCGHEDGHIEIWDVGCLSRPHYSRTNCVPLVTLPPVADDAYNLQYCQQQDLLLAGCDSALLLYEMDMEKVLRGERLIVTKVDLPTPSPDTTSSVVDSIVLVRDSVLAAKCALHGRIYVMTLQRLLDRRQPVTEKNVEYHVNATLDDVVSLEWSNTDNYYMNMGADPVSCTLVCGDDKGTLWLYDLYGLVTGAIPSPLSGGPALENPVPPVSKLLWPDLDDPEVEKAGKLRLDSYDIVVDKCCLSDGAQHVVAVTNNNMVCIWERRLPQDQKE